jgi:hypothetical protein
MSDLEILRERPQLIVDPTGEQSRFHSAHPRPTSVLGPFFDAGSVCSQCDLFENFTITALDAYLNRLLVNIKSDIVQSIHRCTSRLYSFASSGAALLLDLEAGALATPRDMFSLT